MNTPLRSLWEHHRGNLHCPQNWQLSDRQSTSSNSPAPSSITYVPTSAGATGSTQLSRFFTLHPSQHHPLHHTNLTRFNNHFQSVSVTVGGRGVVEELVVSLLHNEQWDFLLPGIPPTNRTFTLPLVIAATYDDQVDLLVNVRIYWDHASLLRQLDIFHMAFHTIIRSLPNPTSFDNALDTLPIIVDGIKICRRLCHPTTQNCNQLISLEALESRNINTVSTHSSSKYAPIGGLDNIAEMTHQLPILPVPSNPNPNRHAISSVFSGEGDYSVSSNDTNNHGMRHVEGLKSSFYLGDGSADPVKPILHHLHHQYKNPSIFAEACNEPLDAVRPSITVDPHRNDSKILNNAPMDGSPFRPAVPLADTSRFTSNIFNSQLSEDLNNSDTANSFSSHRHSRDQLQSSIFNACSGVETQVRSVPVKPLKDSTPFGTDDNAKIIPTNNHCANRNVTLHGHFHGSSFDQTLDQQQEQQSFSGINPDGRTNRSTLFLGDYDAASQDNVPRSMNNGRAAKANQSQIKMGDFDNSSGPAVLPSSRVLQPPGGRSSIFLE